MPGEFERTITLAELPSGKKQLVHVGGKPVLICNVEGTLHAVSNICSHAEQSLDCGRLGRGWIACPVHGARFDLATGAPKNPPATEPIPVFEVRVVGDWIEVAV